MMIINKNTKLIGNKVILVPYQKQHVPKYHQWMQSEELQSLTGSIPLTLEQEYDMQQSWQIDEDKLTFIVLNKETFGATDDEVASMIGDTNLFILSSESKKIAEPEIMIAEQSAQGKGCGYEAMMIMMLYGIENLEIKQFTAKIGQENEASIKMFKKLGFEQTKLIEIFKEVTMELNIDENIVTNLKEKLKGLEIKQYG